MLNHPSKAALTEERDQLLEEKKAWIKPTDVPPEAKAVQENWEAEKAELVKNRDEAMAQAKVASAATDLRYPLIFLQVAREEAEKLKEAERGLRMSNVTAYAVCKLFLYLTDSGF